MYHIDTQKSGYRKITIHPNGSEMREKSGLSLVECIIHNNQYFQT